MSDGIPAHDARSHPSPARFTEGATGDHAHASVAAAVAVYALARGLPRADVEAQIGMSVTELVEWARRVPAIVVPRLTAALRSLDPGLALPLELGRSLAPAFAGGIGHAAAAAPNLGEALTVFHRFAPLLVDRGRCDLSASRSYVAVHITHPAAGNDGGLMCASTAVFLATFLRNQATRDLAVHEVSLAAETAGDVRACARHFRAPVQLDPDGFGARVVLHKQDLGVPLERAQPLLYEPWVALLERRRTALRDPSAEDALRLVREAIHANLLRGDARARSVAASLGASSRTLQRQLARHGTTLKRLVDEELVRLTRELLTEDPRRPVESIAACLGYAEARSFERAIRRASGLTLGALRRDIVAGR